MDIIYEDKNIMVINKPAGKLTQSARSFDVDLTSEVMTYRRKNKEEAYAAVINRLDRPVSGLVLFAKNKNEAARLSRLLVKETFNKQYYAVVAGKPDKESNMLTDWLLKDGKTNTSAVVSKDTKGSKEAKLEYKYIGSVMDKEGREYSLLRIHLITGRHHQIRVQLASRNMPIIGDGKYGKDFASVNQQSDIKFAGRNAIALCAYSLTVDNKTYETKPEFLKYFSL